MSAVVALAELAIPKCANEDDFHRVTEALGTAVEHGHITEAQASRLFSELQHKRARTFGVEAAPEWRRR